METEYAHTQIGKTILAFLFTTLVIIAAITLSDPSHAFLIFGFIILAATAVLFHSLTISIKAGVLYWHFGPGFWKKSVTAKDIIRVDVVRNRWYYGWGIRYTRHGWLYTVSGLSAVEITLKTGKKIRLGSDEPRDLRRAIILAQAGTTIQHERRKP